MAKRKKTRRVQKRGPRGQGSVFPDKRRGGWVGKVPIGRYPSGKTRYTEVRGETQAEVVAKKKLVLPPGPDITVGEWADRWLAGLRIRSGTRENYTVTVRTRIKPAFGSMRLDQLTPWHIESAAASWSDPKSDSPLGVGTLKKALTHTSACLKAAVRARLISENPAALVRRPPAEPVQFDLFTPEELRTVIDTAATNRNWYCFALCAACGLRIGEATALQPGDYDPATGELTIARTRTRAGTNAPKSQRSHRRIRVPTVIRPLLEEGVPGVAPSTVQKRWSKFLALAGLRYRSTHQMRHSVASHAIAKGVPIANVARDLGDSVEMVVKTYLHPTKGADVCGAMEELLGGQATATRGGKPARRRP